MPSNRVDNARPSSSSVREDSTPSALRWHFAPGTEDLQAATRDVPWANLGACSCAQRVKVAENRDVWRIDLPNKTIYAKCYRSCSAVKRVVEAVRGLAAKREWKALRQASKLGVQAPDPIGYARAQTSSGAGYDAILVTAAMPADAQSLEEAWLQVTTDPGLAARQRKYRIIDALAELIARAHAGGLFHRDLHVNNVLIFRNGHGPTAAMIDLHNARLCRGVNLSGVRSNLVQLNQWFARHATRTDRLRFLKAYCGYLRRQLSIPQQATEIYGHKAFAQHVLKQSHRYAARLYRKRDRRILKRNKYFASLQLSGGWAARVALDIKHGRPYTHSLNQLPSKKEWAEMLNDPAGLLGDDSARVLKSSSHRRIVQTDVHFAGSTWTLIAKHEYGSSLVQRLLGAVGCDPLRREFVNGWKCLHRELPVALPLAILERRGTSSHESLLLVEYIPDSRDLDTFGKLHLPEMPDDQALLAKRRICLELARTLRRMWSCGLAHRDFKAANIRVQIPEGDLQRLRIVLVDVDGIRAPRWNISRALLRSLARLDASFASCPAVTRTDRLRLLLAVLREMDHGHPDWKHAWRRITQMSLRDQATIAKTLPWLQPVVGAPAVQ